MPIEKLFTILDDANLYNVEVFVDTALQQFSFKKDGEPFAPPTLYQTTSSIVGALSDFEFCAGETRVYYVGSRFHPYAERKEEITSAYCKPLNCELSVMELKLTHESRGEAKNGKAEVITYSTYPPVQYSLDNNSGWTFSNTFFLLAPGNYTVYTKDRRGCTANQNFEILPFTPPAPKWQLTYYDLPYNRQHILTIYQQGYAGEPITDVIGASEPLFIETDGTNSDRMKIVRGSEATINLKNFERFQYAEIFSSDERKHLVEHKIDNILYWKGWVLPEIWQESYNQPPYTVTFSATDALGTLKEVEFLSLAGEKITGLHTQLDVLALCLQQTDLQLPITTAIHTYETRMSYGDADDPLVQAQVDASQYAGMDCEEVITKILEPYRARVYQQSGEWHIVQVDIPGDAIAPPVLYESEPRTESFQTACEEGVGTWVEFTMARGEFLSEISIEDANRLRDEVFAERGQAYANVNGDCIITEPEEGMLYAINSSDYAMRVDNNSDVSLTIPNDGVPHVVENVSGPLLFSSFRMRKIGLVSFLASEKLRAIVMRAESGGIPVGAIAGANGSGVSTLSIFKENYESTTLQDVGNPNAPLPGNYAAGLNYVVILDQMPEVPKVHFKMELFVNNVLTSDSNRLSSGGSVKARISRLQNEPVDTSFILEVKPIGPTLGLQASPMTVTVGYSNVDYVEFTFTSVRWNAASFNPAIAINIRKQNEDDETIALDTSSQAVWVVM